MTELLTTSDELYSLSDLYALLGRLWLQEVDESLLAQFQKDPLRSSFVHSAEDQELPAETVDDLAADYCRLFVGPRDHFPPLQSVWQEGKLDSQVSDSVRSFADAIAYTPSSAYPNTLIDHLGIELEIMARILRTMAEQLNRGEPTDETEAFAKEFFRRHLCWSDRLLNAALAKTELGFYQVMLRNTQEFLVAEQDTWIVKTQSS